MRIFKTKLIARFTRKEGITDASLADAIERATRGLIDADLGEGLIKQRVARPGKGRSGGYRMLIGYRAGRRAVFLLGFAKNELDNIDDRQLSELRKVGKSWMDADDAAINRNLVTGLLSEVQHDD